MSKKHEDSELKEEYVPTVSIGEQIASVVFMFIGISGVIGGLINFFNSEIDLRITLIMTLLSAVFGIFGFHLWKDNR
jgi:phage shock protein PspC (stress-responsive transcriptional regulator)